MSVDDIEDLRLRFVFGYIQLITDVKYDKIRKFLDDTKQAEKLLDFFENHELSHLFVVLTPTGVFEVYTHFPDTFKYKVFYFVKKERGTIEKNSEWQTLNSSISYGDLNKSPLHHFIAFVNTVLTPVILNERNREDWPESLSEYIKRDLYNLQKKSATVLARIEGKTHLAHPIGIEKIEEQEPISCHGDDVIGSLMYAIETAVVDWSAQINDILKQQSGQAISNGEFPLPVYEYEFWEQRMNCMHDIYEQLIHPKVKKMAVILEVNKSAYANPFKEMFKRVVRAIVESETIVTFLTPLIEYFNDMENLNFEEVKPKIQPMVHLMALLWVNCEYYRNTDRIVILMTETCNLLIQMCRQFLDPTEIIKEEPDEGLIKVNQSLEVLQHFRDVVEDYRQNVKESCQEQQVEPSEWSFHSSWVFGRLNAFIDRLEAIKVYYQTLLDYNRLEKVEILGVVGQTLTARVNMIYEEYQEAYRKFTDATMDCLSTEDQTFPEALEKFMKLFDQLDNRMSTIVLKAFLMSGTTLGAFKLERFAWSAQLLRRVDAIMNPLDMLEHPFRAKRLEEFCRTAPEKCKINLNLPLLRRNATNQTLEVNFDDQLVEVLREVHYLVKDAMTENLELYKAKQDNPDWNAYLEAAEDMILEGLIEAVRCSLSYLATHTEKGKVETPLMETKLNLVENRLIYTPGVQDSQGENLLDLVDSLIQDITDQSRLIPSLLNPQIDPFAPKSGKSKAAEKPDEGTAEEHATAETAEDAEGAQGSERAEGIEGAEGAGGPIPGVASMKLGSEHSGEGSDRSSETSFLQYIKSLTGFSQQILVTSEVSDLIKKVIEHVRGAMRAAAEFQANLEANYAVYWAEDRTEFIRQFCRYGRLLTKDDLGPTGEIEAPENPPTLEQFREQILKYDRVYDEVEHIEDSHIFDSWLRADLKPFKQSLLAVIHQWSDKFKQYLVDHVTSTLENLKAFIEDSLTDMEIEGDAETVDYDKLVTVLERLKLIREAEDATDAGFEPLRETVALLKEFGEELPESMNKLLEWNTRLTKIEEGVTEMQVSAKAFEVRDIPTYMELKAMRREMKVTKRVWDYINMFRSYVTAWKTSKWKEIDFGAIDEVIREISMEIRSMDKEVRQWPMFQGLEAELKDLNASVTAVRDLQNPAVKERHWIELMSDTGRIIEINDETTLADLLSLNLHKFEDEVRGIVSKASNEQKIERDLEKIEQVWSEMTFEYDTHDRTGLELPKQTEQLTTTLEEIQVKVLDMLGNRDNAFSIDKINYWYRTLSTADQVLSIWFETQRVWSGLESIFVLCDDIKAQLPKDTALFMELDEEFRVLIEEMRSKPKVLDATTDRPELCGEIQKIRDGMAICEKALSDYLETKRLSFPRFYFVSQVDVTDIVSNGKVPAKVLRHLSKLFDSICSLTFAKENAEIKHATKMIAKDGEEVKFAQSFDLAGQVEEWLNALLIEMRNTLRKILAEAVAAYEEKPRDQWIFDYPAQVALTGSQIGWNSEVQIAFARLEEGLENAMKEYNKKQISQLGILIQMLLTDLTAGDRQKIMTLCTIDVHNRDIVGKLITQKVESSQAFTWLSQLRHRWDDSKQDCFANICDAQFAYAYEYLGNTPRLVITPLTDRCYITLTQSLHLCMSGAPAGPAGTGKTETTKDLGRALGVMVYVFNCSEQMDYMSVGNIYKGLAQAGAWGCFDEFNRISVEVLSVVAVQVKSIQDAIRLKKEKFNFLGEIIPLDAAVGLFITMNPGYAGRTELPENLKALFRPCAMVVPDFELICEIMLVAQGFLEATILARKFITLYQLCKELLSKQDHYDWGLRAIKSVLVVAGALKRGNPEHSEDSVLMRALRDFNIPKLVTEDMAVFLGLISDLFPNLDAPRKRNLQFEADVKRATEELGLQPEDSFILKIPVIEFAKV
ncbi:Dynein beta chain ciliary [Fasciola gigantica]|uniref:Dynein beta chain ciliary n=1 Tax=Fasciola gigantica TaxID=46835 RepID=A0A504YKU2_FASGI|nr:Dynein beta chain ciliary [Fasciola gigantica]